MTRNGFMLYTAYEWQRRLSAPARTTSALTARALEGLPTPPPPAPHAAGPARPAAGGVAGAARAPPGSPPGPCAVRDRGRGPPHPRPSRLGHRLGAGRRGPDRGLPAGGAVHAVRHRAP